MDEEERYAEEKFSIAVETLATDASDIRARLQMAIMSFIPMSAERLADPEIRSRFESIMNRVTRTPGKGSEGAIQASLNEMTNSECEDVAKSIWEMFEILREKLAECE